MKKIHGYLLLFLLLFPNVIFGNNTQEYTSKLTKVTLQLHWKYQFEFAGFVAAKEKGFYKDIGLDVKLKEYESEIDVINDVIERKVNYGIGNSGILLSYLQDKPLVLLASFFKRSAMILVTKPYVKSPKDLIGKRVMGDTKKDFNLEFKYMFTSQGVSIDDLKLIKHTYNINDFAKGKVDAMASFISDQPYKLDKLGIKYNILDPSDYGTYNLFLELFTSKYEATKYPLRTKKFINASIKGWKYALNHKKEIIDIIHKKYAPHVPKRDLENEAQKIEKLILPYAYNVGSIDINFLKKQKEIFEKEYKTDKTRNISNYIFHIKKSNELTKEEKKYIKDRKTIKICTNPNWTPIEFTKKGVPQGISIDTINLIKEKLHIKYQFIKTESWKQSQDFLKNKKCDILPSAIKTSEREKYANFTEPYLRYNLAIITTKDKPLVSNLESIINKTMSRKKGSGLITKLKAKYPNIKIMETKGYKESLKKVADGEVYFTIATIPVLSYYKNKFGLNNLQIAGYTHMKYNLSIAVRKDEPILLDILSKSLASISKNTQNIIYEKWTRQNIIKKFDYTLFWQIIGLLLLGFLFFIFYHIKIEKYNHALKTKIDKAVKETKEKELLLQQQSRHALMGEMISMIAHQWRQPLSAISSTSMAINLKAKLNKLDKESAINLSSKISDYSQHLSATIDDFREFFKANKEKRETTYTELINSVLDIIEVSIKNKNIKLIKDLKCEEKLYTYPNEIKQVILNLIKNAEDILLDNKVKKPYIKITTYLEKGKLILEVSDNAGGIPKDIIGKIFDPYFSTKTKKDGTGLGLYMSKTIIQEHCKGILSASNNEDGAVFRVELGEDDG